MEWLLIGLTAMLVVLTGMLIIYSERMVRSSDKLQKTMEKLQITEEEVSEIGLAQIAASIERTTMIPKAFFGEDLEIIERNMEGVFSSLSGGFKPRWNWDENSLKITYQLDRLPIVFGVLLANVRKPENIVKILASDPISVLIIRSKAKQGENAAKLLLDLLPSLNKSTSNL